MSLSPRKSGALDGPRDSFFFLTPWFHCRSSGHPLFLSENKRSAVIDCVEIGSIGRRNPFPSASVRVLSSPGPAGCPSLLSFNCLLKK